MKPKFKFPFILGVDGVVKGLVVCCLSGGRGMKVSYDRESDILMLGVGEDKISYAEEMGPLIVHLTEKGKPVEIEILDASEFLSQTVKLGMRAGSATEVEV